MQVGHYGYTEIKLRVNSECKYFGVNSACKGVIRFTIEGKRAETATSKADVTDGGE